MASKVHCEKRKKMEKKEQLLEKVKKQKNKKNKMKMYYEWLLDAQLRR